MRIAIFGLGYVGCVTGACLARMGHEVYGVDVNPVKVRMINAGQPTVLEKGLDRMVAQAVGRGRLRATLDAQEALEGAEVSLVCVGTPSRPDGTAEIDHVLHAAGEIGRALGSARRYHTVAVRSTVPPGTMEGKIIPALERRSRRKAERDFGACFHPEFLREGSSVGDFFHPAMTVIGAGGARSARRLLELWRPLRAPLWITSLNVAEMLKYANNAFHALKVAFANEIGALSKSLGIDSRAVMEIFVADRKLNISPLYLRPGFAFGGPCLPKDVRALARLGRERRVELPVISGILPSNRRHLERAVELVRATGKQRVGVLGLVFKADTDDLRESPACALVRRLLRARRSVRIYDPRVQLSRLVGANRAFVEEALPQLPKLLVASAEEILLWSEVIVLTGAHGEFSRIVRGLTKGQILIDLMGVAPSGVPAGVIARGLSW